MEKTAASSKDYSLTDINLIAPGRATGYGIKTTGMKAICISSKWPKLFSVGSTYIITETYCSPYNGKNYWYHKFEHTGSGVGFRVEHFAIVSEIEEEAMIEVTNYN